jgi:outer membrane protein OmpA-like peptidoglycan-associated protein
MSFRLRAFTPMLVALFVFVLALASSALFAQDEPTPKVDVFAGYSWYNPGLTVNGIKLSSDAKGFGIAPTWNFTNHLGITLDGAGHFGPDGNLGQNQVGTIMVGPRFIWRQEHFYPFVQALVGTTILTIDSATPGGTYSQWGPAIKAGGGFDIPLTKRISFRLFEADYLWSHHNLYPQTLTRSNDLSGAELRTGVVFNFGGAPPLPPMAMSCGAATPAAVMAGEPVSVTASVTNIPPKKTLTYDWKSTGGKLSGNGTAAQVDTTGLAPGNYTVTATATDPKPRKDQGPLSCTANFTVNEPPKHPPTISCSANPTTVQAGQTSAITCTAGNPDNRPLTYNHTSTGGRLTPDGANATLDTAGASAGPITVNSTVTDDRGLSANTSTSVNVEVPPPPPQASNIGTCQFDKDKKRPWRVDNACKAILDEVALRLQREADSKLVVVGHSDPEADKKDADRVAAQRAVNSKEYLSGGEAKQQIDPTRIEVRSGAPNGQTADYWLVPAGATFNQADTQPVDENAVKAPPKKPVHHHHAAKKAPAAQ